MNGKHILIWEDSVLGDPPLNTYDRMTNMKEWLISKYIVTLWDILSWNDDEDRTWKDRQILNYPNALENEVR